MPLPQVVKRLATYDDLREVPKHLVGEIVDGELYTSPRPATLHSRSSIVVPDLAGWRRERMKEMPDAPSIDLPPDWICEIPSSSTEAFDRSIKMSRYAESRVQFAWLIEPRARTLEVYCLKETNWPSFHGTKATTSSVLSLSMPLISTCPFFGRDKRSTGSLQRRRVSVGTRIGASCVGAK